MKKAIYVTPIIGTHRIESPVIDEVNEIVSG